MRADRLWIALGLVGISIVCQSCSGDTATAPDPNAVATTVTAVSGDHQVGEVGAPLAHPIAVRVADQNGHPMPGASVTFAVSHGGGSLGTATATTNAQGVASTTWTMGYVVNLDQPTATASVPGLDGALVRFSARATLTAGTLSVVTGSGQSGFTNREAPTRPSVRVTTPGPAGVPVSGVTVLWSVTAGGGTADASSTTDAAGMASARWTLGDTPGTDSQILRATVASLGGAPVEFVASAISPPASIVKIAGDSQSGTAAQPLSQPLVVEVRNAAGDPLPGIPVHWTAYDNCGGWCGPGGVGSVSALTTLTDSTGRASVAAVLPQSATWAGEFYDMAFGAWLDNGVPGTGFFAHVSPGSPVRASSWYGNAQSAPAGSQLPQPIAVAVFDEFYNPVPGVSVQWAAAPGSGSTELTSSDTDSNGVASTRWSIGTTVGINNQTATATVAGLAGSPVTFTASATAGP